MFELVYVIAMRFDPVVIGTGPAKLTKHEYSDKALNSVYMLPLGLGECKKYL